MAIRLKFASILIDEFLLDHPEIKERDDLIAASDVLKKLDDDMRAQDDAHRNHAAQHNMVQAAMRLVLSLDGRAAYDRHLDRHAESTPHYLA